MAAIAEADACSSQRGVVECVRHRCGSPPVLHREVFVDERARQLGHAIFDSLLRVHQRIHAAHQVRVTPAPHVDVRRAGRLQPAQHAQLGLLIAKPAEPHHADRVPDGRGELARQESQRTSTQALAWRAVQSEQRFPPVSRGLAVTIGSAHRCETGSIYDHSAG